MIIDTIAKKLLFSTTCIEGSDSNNNSRSGTGFVLSHYFPGYGPEWFLVTNKHVIEGLRNAKICFTREIEGKPQIGNTFGFEVASDFERAFTGHPDPEVDVAVLPLSYPLNIAQNAQRKAFLMDLSTELLIPDKIAEQLDVVLPILFVGYPNGYYDSVHRTPIFRRGTIATPVQLDYDGRPVFLIDASVFPGSSGSAVFTYDHNWIGNGANFYLLGILAEVFVRVETGTPRSIPAPTQNEPTFETPQMLDLGVVFKAHLILETILECWKQKESELRKLKGNHRKS